MRRCILAALWCDVTEGWLLLICEASFVKADGLFCKVRAYRWTLRTFPSTLAMTRLRRGIWAGTNDTTPLSALLTSLFHIDGTYQWRHHAGRSHPSSVVLISRHHPQQRCVTYMYTLGHRHLFSSAPWWVTPGLVFCISLLLPLYGDSYSHHFNPCAFSCWQTSESKLTKLLLSSGTALLRIHCMWFSL